MKPAEIEDVAAWRAIILFGRNTATYKIALAHCLADFVDAGVADVSMLELAAAFFDLYGERLVAGKPQLAHAGRLTVMEHVVLLHRLGRLERGAAIERVAAEAFGDVLPRFHTVYRGTSGVSFYEATPSGLKLTDRAFDVLGGPERHHLLDELGSRWDLLEGAFTLMREPGELASDVRALYLAHGYERTPLTGLRPALHGYQHGLCFYCAEPLGDDVHVDHVIPRQFVSHDQPWNLVLAHGFCNEQKSDALPGRVFMEKLVARNERLVESNHPIRERVITDLGTTPEQRRRATARVYADAERAIPYTWAGSRGYDPATDPFFKAFVRGLVR